MWPRGTCPSHLGQKPLAISASQGHQFVKELPLGDTQRLYVAERALKPSQSLGTKPFLDRDLIPMQTKYFYLNGEQRCDEGLPSTHVHCEVVQGPSLGTDEGSLCRLSHHDVVLSQSEETFGTRIAPALNLEESKLYLKYMQSTFGLNVLWAATGTCPEQPTK